jgi:protein-disulfide isomerase
VPNLAQFTGCILEGRFKAGIGVDIGVARDLRVYGTPAFIFDGRLVSGVGALPEIEAWVERVGGEGAVAGNPL